MNLLLSLKYTAFLPTIISKSEGDTSRTTCSELRRTPNQEKTLSEKEIYEPIPETSRNPENS